MNDTQNTNVQDESKNIIKVHNLGKRYRFLWALKKVSLTFEKNTITGIIGPNGAGKSTLLNLIGSIIVPTTGSISIFGQDINKKSEELRKNIVLFSYHSFLYDELTGWDNLLFWLKIYDIQNKIKNKSLRSYIIEEAEKFGIINWLDRPVRELSTGMRKKVEFLRMMLIKPSLILLDEPFSGMDPKNISIFLEEIQKFQKYCTIVIASHNLDLISKVCHNIHILKKGLIVESLVNSTTTGIELKKLITELAD